VSDQLSYSFSDPGSGLHSFGTQTGGAIVFASDGTSARGAVELLASDPAAGHFEVKLDGVYLASFDALGAPVEFDRGARRVWFCALSGAARNTAGEVVLGGFGTITVGERDLGSATLRRLVWTGFGEDLAFVLAAERPRKGRGHGDESVTAFALRGVPLVASAIKEPLLSSTWDGDGELLRAGLELWESDDDDARPLRIGGETVAYGELGGDSKTLLSVAFLSAHHAGREGVGCYELVRRAD
jgi:hypothetical protein